MIIEGEITKEVKAKLVTCNINYLAENRVVSAKRFYTEGDSEVILKIVYATFEGVEPQESDLQECLNANPIA